MAIQSILDTDLYKLTMQQAIMRSFPDIEVEYSLILRTKRSFPPGFDQVIKDGLLWMYELALTDEEAAFLQKRCPFLTPLYIDFLRGYHFDPDEVNVKQEDDQIILKIRGQWYRTVLWEVPLMAMISEIYFEKEKIHDRNIRRENNHIKAVKFETNEIMVADFGTRRRHSFENQNEVVGDLKEYAPHSFIGTSNPYLAMLHDLRPIGTIAHEFMMAIAAICGYKMANRIAMEKWIRTYQGSLGIMLTDTFTSEIFFKDFTTKYAKLFDGIRQDSFDPIEFAKRAIEHYKKLQIDPMNKTIIFSDSLDADKAKKIHNFCKGKIKDAYGIGTNLTNDVGVIPLNMVIKLTAVRITGNWIPTIKLSDDPGKHVGNKEEIELCRRILNL